MDNFLGFPIVKNHNSAVILSTEDDELAVSFLLNKQNKGLMFPPEAYKALRFIFETDDPVGRIDQELTIKGADVVIVDAFSDLYGGEMNATNKVRSFLNEFANVAKKHECLIIFLHHTGKGKDHLEPSKHNLLGSQGFEAKMRLVLELRKDNFDPKIRHLCVVKGNYLPEEYKNESYVLEFDDNMLFHSKNERVPFDQLGSAEKPDKSAQKEANIKRAKELKEQGFSQVKIAATMGVTEASVSRYLKDDST
jgi:RecA-family ATPase